MTIKGIAVASYSLNRRFKSGELKLLDFPHQVKKEFNVNAVELNSPFFESLEDDYLKELKNRVDKNGIQIVNICVAYKNCGDIASTEEIVRKEAVENFGKWIRIAKKLGSPSFRTDIGHDNATEEEISVCIKSLAELSREAEKEGIVELVENHGRAIPKNPDVIVRIMEEVGGDIGTCPDFGNFPEEILYEGLQKIAKYAKVVHAKFFEFDEKGEDTKIDARRAIKIFKDIGYNGYFSIEFEGKGDDHEGVIKSIELCKRYI